MRLWLAASLAVPVLALTPHSGQSRQDPVTAARGFLQSLDDGQQSRAIVPFNDDYRTTWRYTPARRRGLSWKEMSGTQAGKAKVLLMSVLSEIGYKRTQDVRTIEEIFAK